MKIAGKMQALVGLALLSAGLMVAGCKSAPKLTQQQALTLIQAKYDSMPGTPFTIAVNDLGMQEGVTANYWLGVKRYPNGYWADLKLTPEGKKVVTLPGGGELLQWRPDRPNQPHYSINVNSVALAHLKAANLGDVQSGPNKTMTVDYSERADLSALPAPLQQIAQNPGNMLSTRRTATFVLSNGAWKLQSID